MSKLQIFKIKKIYEQSSGQQYRNMILLERMSLSPTEKW